MLEKDWERCQCQLAYKAEWAGKSTKFAPPNYTRQTCSGRRAVDGSQRKDKRNDCRVAVSIDADHYAAINIVRWGISQVRVGKRISQEVWRGARGTECSDNLRARARNIF